MSSNFLTESNFKFEDLFFSRTNHKGTIQSANSVFQRISKFSWDELLMKPHNVIRHPGMPRGVFHLLWEYILANKPIGAYVVNKSKDGSYYWVFALVIPQADGFTSMRLKPSSPIFEVVKQKYAKLLELEESQNLSPKASQEILLKEIQQLNFESYQHFMTEALTHEIEYRQKALKLEPIQAILKLRKILSLGEELQNKCEEIFTAYKKIALVPLNLEVQSALIGQDAATISVVSSQYSGISELIKKETEKFVTSGNLGSSIKKSVQACQFDVCSLILTRELITFFKNEKMSTPVDKYQEMRLLEELARQRVESVRKSMTAVETVFNQFSVVFTEIRQLTSALDIVGITGKIEAVKIKQASQELLLLLDDLMTFKTTLKQYLKDIDNIGKDLINQTHELKEAI